MPKQNYKVEDINKLQSAYPQFVKLVPDSRKIAAALKLGIDIPGVRATDDESDPKAKKAV